MQPTRREFLRVSTIGGVAASVLGFDLTPAYAQVRELKIARTTETRSTCPYCSVSCGVILHTLGDRSRNIKPKIVHVEGDADHPINQGTLCPKGITLKQNIVNDLRLTTVRYRAPGSRVWEEKSWDWAIDRIARQLKETRDEKLRGEGRARADDQRADRCRRHRRLHGNERAQLPPGQGLSRRSGCDPDGAAGPNMTRTDGGQSGRHIRTRSDDERLDRHPECGCRAGDGWQSG